MPGKKRNYRQILLCTVVFMTAKLTALFSLPCLRRPVDCGPHRAHQSAAIALFAGYPAVLGTVSAVFCARRKRPAHQTEKNEPHFCGPQQFPPRRGANIYDPCEGSCCRSGRQLSATLCATASQYLAAVRGGHALAEAVLLGALTLLRLERSLHNFVHLPVLNFTDGHRHRSGARRGHMPLPVRII